MRRDCLAVSALVVLILLAAPEAGFGTDGTSQHKFRLCPGDFALCAASTCTPTGGTIVVNNGTAPFLEAQCTCPIFRGPGLGDLTGGNMQDSCEPPTIVHGAPTDKGIWSLYGLTCGGEIPQAINDWKKHGPKAEAPIFVCSESLGLGNQLANCFSFACVRAGTIHGVPVATCYCPLGENLDGGQVSPDTGFSTQAGQCNEDICSQHPVSGPFPPEAQGGACIHIP
jgi:hypothetical protein